MQLILLLNYSEIKAERMLEVHLLKIPFSTFEQTFQERGTVDTRRIGRSLMINEDV